VRRKEASRCRSVIITAKARKSTRFLSSRLWQYLGGDTLAVDHRKSSTKALWIPIGFSLNGWYVGRIDSSGCGAPVARWASVNGSLKQHRPVTMAFGCLHYGGCCQWKTLKIFRQGTSRQSSNSVVFQRRDRIWMTRRRTDSHDIRLNDNKGGVWGKSRTVDNTWDKTKRKWHARQFSIWRKK